MTPTALEAAAMIAVAALTVGMLASRSGSPAEAALRIFFPPENRNVSIQRSNVVGRFATVTVRNGRIEGLPWHNALLLQKFSLGWQPVDFVSDDFCASEHGISPRTAALLLRGMPVPKGPPVCAFANDDRGPVGEVEAVRSQMRGPVVPSVRVWKTFALGTWMGAGGGESLYAKRAGHWLLVKSGGGAMGTDQMKTYGVPKSAWCAFGIYDAGCPKATTALTTSPRFIFS